MRYDHTPLTDDEDLNARDVVYKDPDRAAKYLRRKRAWDDDKEERSKERVKQARKDALRELERRVEDNWRELQDITRGTDDLAQQVQQNTEAIQSIVNARVRGV